MDEERFENSEEEILEPETSIEEDQEDIRAEESPEDSPVQEGLHAQSEDEEDGRAWYVVHCYSG